MGSKGMNAELNAFIKLEFKDDKQDIFSAFTTRISKLSLARGYFSLMTPFNWMFLSSFEKFRENLLRNCTITSLVRPEFHSFFDSAYVSICGFCCINAHHEEFEGVYIDTNEFYGAELQPLKALEAIRDSSCSWRHTASSRDFHKISGSPIAYWLSEKSLSLFGGGLSIGTLSAPRQGLATTDNNRFVRLWPEIPHDRIKFDSVDREDAEASGMKWFPYNKGGDFRRWYGNNENIVNWESDGKEIKDNICRKYPYLNGNPGFVAKNQECYFQQGITWTYISSSYLGARLSPSGFVFDVAGSSVFPSDHHRDALLLYICSSVASYFIRVVNPTLNIQAGSIGKLPITQQFIDAPHAFKPHNASSLIDLSKSDWDAYETSWDFTTLPLLQLDHRGETLDDTYTALRTHWQGMTDEMQRLEEENNRIFIDAYGLQDELTPEVPLKEITLTCNPERVNDFETVAFGI